jgi:hypothetical protein
VPKSSHDPPPDEVVEPLIMDEFEEQVAAALKVDPAGLSGKHRKELTPEEAQREAVRLSWILKSKGCDDSYITRWWNHAAYEELGGRTPNAAWLRGEYAEVRALVESLPDRSG